MPNPNRSTSWLAPLAAAGGAAALVAWRRARARREGAERLAAATLEALLAAIDANDALTGAHVRRTADYALVLAHACGLSDEECRRIERVALFHDVGKIHEALFDIVHDDDQLDEDERRAIATHPARGAEVLAPLVAFYPDLPEGVLAHHERWDGTGYPRGLRGCEIPLAARIVAIADTFDALTHRRRYRPGRSSQKGADIVAEGRGTQFDPDLVDLFLRPDVFACIERRMAEAVEREAAAPAPMPGLQSPHRASSRPPAADRRHLEAERAVPQVSFRWRQPSAVGSLEPRAADGAPDGG